MDTILFFLIYLVRESGIITYLVKPATWLVLTTYLMEWIPTYCNDYLPNGMTTYLMEWLPTHWNDYLPNGMTTYLMEWLPT